MSLIKYIEIINVIQLIYNLVSLYLQKNQYKQRTRFNFTVKIIYLLMKLIIYELFYSIELDCP